MTRKEKIAEMEPDAISKIFIGGVVGCPHCYPFLGITEDRGRCLIDEPVYSGTELFEKCEKCWNTEWKEPVRSQWQQDILDKFMRVI